MNKLDTHRPFTGDFRPDIRQWLIWIPTAIGIGLLIGILVTFAQLAFVPPRTSETGPLPEPVVAVFPSMTPVATSTPSPRTPVSTSPTQRATVPAAARDRGRGAARAVTPSPGPPVAAPGPKRPPKPKLTWTHQPRDWAVELRFSDGVGRLDASWVGGAPEATTWWDAGRATVDSAAAGNIIRCFLLAWHWAIAIC